VFFAGKSSARRIDFVSRRTLPIFSVRRSLRAPTESQPFNLFVDLSQFVHNLAPALPEFNESNWRCRVVTEGVADSPFLTPFDGCRVRACSVRPATSNRRCIRAEFHLDRIHMRRLNASTRRWGVVGRNANGLM